MSKEMTAVEYLKAKARMTDNCKISCSECLLNHYCCRKERENAEEMAVIVQKWSEEHPLKTRQSEFLKMFPNTPKYNDCFLGVCPKVIGEISEVDCKFKKESCITCKKDFWLAELPEEVEL